MIICTNPPYSQFREFFNIVKNYNYLLIANKNSYICKDVFPHVMDKTLKFGYTKPNNFLTPSGALANMQALQWWYTNLEVRKPNSERPLYEGELKRYDNMNAYECPTSGRLPDTDKTIGVPITYVFNQDPRYNIVGIAAGNSWRNYRAFLESLDFRPDMKYGGGLGVPILDGRPKYTRLLIRRNDYGEQ